MKSSSQSLLNLSRSVLVLGALLASAGATCAAEPPPLQVGLAVREVTPELPIWLAGYAARNKPAEHVDLPLVIQAVALQSEGGDTAVLVALDNCEVSRDLIGPAVQKLESKHRLAPGAVMVVNSHSHSTPVVVGALMGMYPLKESDREQVVKYGQLLQQKLTEVVEAALADFKPAFLEHAAGRATFAVNRRIYRGGQVAFGENLDAPADFEVPVLRIKGTNGALQAILFGYACHGTSVAGGDGFYEVSPEYMGYARQHLETLHPGAMAVFLTGMGADSNPMPRGSLFEAKRHGLELAGAVAGVLARPMRPVQGAVKLAYREVDLPLEAAPSRELIEADARTNNVYLKARAENYLRALNEGRPVPATVKLPIAAIGIGHDLTFVAMAGEVVVDYGRQFKRMFAAQHPWTIGYAYDVPCYIPTTRIVKEGGYEADSSLIYYGLYGPFKPAVEDLLLKGMSDLVKKTSRN